MRISRSLAAIDTPSSDIFILPGNVTAFDWPVANGFRLVAIMSIMIIPHTSIIQMGYILTYEYEFVNTLVSLRFGISLEG